MRGSTSDEGAVLVFKVMMMSAVEFSPPDPRAHFLRGILHLKDNNQDHV